MRDANGFDQVLFNKLSAAPGIGLRFITQGGFVSTGIRYVTFSEWSHVELIDFEKQTYIGAHSSGGVQARSWDYCKPSHEARYLLPCTAEQQMQIMAYARSKIGTPYNLKDIVGLLIHHNMTSDGRVICSQFATEAFQAGGFNLLNVLPGYTNLISPEMLHLSPYLIGRNYYRAPNL